MHKSELDDDSIAIAWNWISSRFSASGGQLKSAPDPLQRYRFPGCACGYHPRLLKWSHGAFLYTDYSSNEVPPVFLTLRRDGRLVSTARLEIPQTDEYWFNDFDRGSDGTIVFAGGSHAPNGDLTGGFLKVTADYVTWLSPKQGKVSRAFEVNTASIKAYSLPELPGLTAHTMVAGFTRTDSGAVYICLGDSSPKLHTNYRLDRERFKWVPLEVRPLGEDPFTPKLIGSDGEQLVLRFGQSAGFFDLSK